MYYRETIVAGKTILRSLRASARKEGHQNKRRERTAPTSDAVRKVNLNNAVRMLTAKLNHNFCMGDYHLTLTYAEAPSRQEAKKDLEKFIRNMRAWCKRNDREFKWVAVTEYDNHRIHHHIVMSWIELDVIQHYWTLGYVYPVLLDETGNYYKLAEYLIKETDKTFRDPDAVQRQRYSTSRNVVMPEIKREEVAGREVTHEIKPPKGYYVDHDTVRRYEHAILGVECMEYIMINDDEKVKLKRWRRGVAVSPQRPYKDYERQLSMDWREE